jgi:hypothetical protein
MTKKSLLFLGSGIDVERISDEDLALSHIVALDPAAQAALKLRNVTYSNSLDFYGREGHESVLKESVRLAEETLSLFKNLEFEGVTDSFRRTLVFNFLNPLRYWLTQLYIIHQAVKRFQPDDLMCVMPKHLDPIGNDIHLVVQSYAEAHGLASRTIGRSRRGWFQPPGKWLGQWCHMVAFELLLSGYRICNSGHAVVLATSHSYNLGLLATNVAEALPEGKPIFLSTNLSTLKKSWKKILCGEVYVFFDTISFLTKEQKEKVRLQVDKTRKKISESYANLEKYPPWTGVDIRFHMMNWANHLLLEITFKLARRVAGLIRILRLLRPQVALSQHAVGSFGAVGELCRLNGIPAMLVTHGSHVPQNDKRASLEWTLHARTIFLAGFEYVAIQTPWAEKFFRSCQYPLLRSLTTGPLLFGKHIFSFTASAREILRNELLSLRADKKIMLHVSTPKLWKGGNRPWVYETIDEYVRNIEHMIKAAEESDKWHLVIRFRSLPGLCERDFRSLMPPGRNYTICTGGLFEQYLNAADLLVSYSSTALEEALQSRVPVLQYDPDGKYMHLPGTIVVAGKLLLPSTVYAVLDNDALTWALHQIALNLEPAKYESLDWGQHIYQFDKNMGWLQQLCQAKPREG